MKLQGRLHRLWLGWQAIGIEFTFLHPNDVDATTFDVGLPMWPWRIVCWLGHHEPYDRNLDKDNYCVICRKDLND